MLYTYYYTYFVFGWYERPIWYRVQNDFQYYADRGVLGLRVENRSGEGNDSMCNWQLAEFDKSQEHTTFFTADGASKMNQLSFWLFYKLAWNPYEDVDALIVEFCDKVYGEASDEMQDYYRILHEGWDIGSESIQYEFNAHIAGGRDLQYYYDYFLDVETEDGVYVLDGLKDALTRAWEAADDRAKEFIRYPYEIFRDWEHFLN
jgi:hypothetical protein